MSSKRSSRSNSANGSSVHSNIMSILKQVDRAEQQHSELVEEDKDQGIITTATTTRKSMVTTKTPTSLHTPQATSINSNNIDISPPLAEANSMDEVRLKSTQGTPVSNSPTPVDPLTNNRFTKTTHRKQEIEEAKEDEISHYEDRPLPPIPPPEVPSLTPSLSESSGRETPEKVSKEKRRHWKTIFALFLVIFFMVMELLAMALSICFFILAGAVDARVHEGLTSRGITRSLATIGMLGLILSLSGLFGMFIGTFRRALKKRKRKSRTEMEADSAMPVHTRLWDHIKANLFGYLFLIGSITVSLFQLSMIKGLQGLTVDNDHASLSEDWNRLTMDTVQSIQQQGSCCGFDGPIDRAVEPCLHAVGCESIIKEWLSALNDSALKLHAGVAIIESIVAGIPLTIAMFVHG